MRCMRCGNDVFPSTTVEAIELGVGVLVVRNVPCYKCDECDEILYAGDVAQRLEELVEQAGRFAQELIVIDYRQAA